MALTHNSEWFSIDQCKLYKMTADVTTNPTYSAGVALPGVRMVSIEPDVLNKELFGDNKIIGRAAKTRQIMSKLGYAKPDLDILNIIGGGTAVDAGTTPNQTATYTQLGADFGGYFKIEYRILQASVGIGSVNVTFFKCKISDFGLPSNQEDFTIPTLGVAAIATVSNDQMYKIAYNESAAALS